MAGIGSLSRVLALGAFVAMCTVACTKKPNQEEISKLEEAKAAAESAEQKLADLRKERTDLEAQVQQKESELKATQQERDDLKQKMGK